MGKIFEKLKIHQDSIFLVSCIMLVGLVGFGLGRLSAEYQTAELNINSTLVNSTDLDKIITTSTKSGSGVAGINNNTPVASKNNSSVVSKKTDVPSVNREVVDQKVIGNKQSKIYHLENCPGALRMKAENKIFFASILEAQQAGYKPAGNCPGLR